MLARLTLFIALLLPSGCLIVDTGVINPVPAMSTIAVAPFFNLSQEPSVDARRFALAYFTELQKVPGYEVIPLGITEQLIVDLQLDINDVEDVLTLANELGVDAIVVGAVTDYQAYYPPRIGMQVSWYSPYDWRFSPGVQTDVGARKQVLDSGKKMKYFTNRRSPDCEDEFCKEHVIRGQSQLDETVVTQPYKTEPVMSYTRMFDGTDERLVARLRDYVELSGDRRSGGWEGYMHRSEDFIRFTAHLMIEEMLTLHGGEGHRRYVFKLRKQR